ncbi:MAG: peptidase S41 [Bacteroidetes bacterium]|nr:MAG: peptidase S41 [Bacteroidota bacterium]
MVRIGANIFCLIVLSFSWLSGCGISNQPLSKVEESKIPSENVNRISIVQKLKQNPRLPIEKQIDLYYNLKKDSADVYSFGNEDELTMYGYSYLWENKVLEAIEVFKLIVAEFPNSSNAYDSLAEAYLQNNDKDLSLINYEKSLALDPGNFNAEDQIDRMKFPEKVAEKPVEKFFRTYNVNEYRADLDQLGNTLLKVHPNALKFISKEDFWQSIETKKALITESTTYAEFAWHCSEIIANVHCSHTNMGSFDYEAAMLPLSARFPLQTRWVSDKLFVINPFNNDDKVKVKDEILSINGLAVSDIILNSYKHIPSQGYIQTTKNHFFNTWNAAMIPYALGFPESYQIIIKGVDHPVLLHKAATIEEPFFDMSLDISGKNLSLEFLDNDETALLTVASFNYYRWNDFEVFKSFIDSSFNEINKKGVKNLVIDVRLNRGGSQSASIHLLQYLVDEPFTYFSNAQFAGKNEKIEGEEVVYPFENRFKGKSYFMMDGIGNSTTGHFMSIVKYLNVGTIVGEELGSNQFCSAGMTTRRLSNTKLMYYVANNTHESLALSLPDETGILPDHYVTQSIDEYLNKTDAVKVYTMKLIKK